MNHCSTSCYYNKIYEENWKFRGCADEFLIMIIYSQILNKRVHVIGGVANVIMYYKFYVWKRRF